MSRRPRWPPRCGPRRTVVVVQQPESAGDDGPPHEESRGDAWDGERLVVKATPTARAAATTTMACGTCIRPGTGLLMWGAAVTISASACACAEAALLNS